MKVYQVKIKKNEINLTLQNHPVTGTPVQLEWKDVFGYEDLYEVSNYGHVVNKRNQSVLSPFSGDTGYNRVSISGIGKSKRVLVHRLLAEAFISNPQNKAEVNHISSTGDRLNNFIFNLEWATRQENKDHAKLNLTRKSTNRKQLSTIEVSMIREIHGSGKSIRQLSKDLNILTSTISYVVNNKTYKQGEE